MKSFFSAETVGKLRRMLHVPSPMNVWKRQFTELTWFDEILLEHQRDVEFLSGDRWPVGSTVTIAKPQSFIRWQRN